MYEFERTGVSARAKAKLCHTPMKQPLNRDRQNNLIISRKEMEEEIWQSKSIVLYSIGKSTSCLIFMLNGSPVCWRLKRQANSRFLPNRSQIYCLDTNYGSSKMHGSPNYLILRRPSLFYYHKVTNWTNFLFWCLAPLDRSWGAYARPPNFIL